MRNRRFRWLFWASAAVLAVGVIGLAYVLALNAKPARTEGVQEARDEMARLRFHRAIAILTPVIEQNPENAEALVARGVCHLETGRPAQARPDFRRALEARPGLPSAELGLAGALVAEGDYERGIEAARKVAEANPQLVEPYAILGRAHHGLFDRAARECIRIAEEDPKNPLAIAVAGEMRSGRLEPARAFWEDLYGRDPAAAVRSRFQVHLEAAEEHLRLAIENLRIGCGDTPERPGAGDAGTWLHLATLLLGTGDHADAERAADRALERPGVNRVRAVLVKAEVARERAGVLVREGAAESDPQKMAQAAEANERAIELLEALVQAYPDAAVARERLAMHYVRAGRFDEADLEARHSLKLMPSPTARYVRGIVRLAKGEYDPALAELLSVQAQMRDDPRFHFSLGLAYYRRGGPTASAALASTEFRRVIELRPNFVPARFRLAKLYLLQGWYQEAREQCERILAVRGRPPALNVQVYLMLSEAHRGLRDYEQTLRWLDRAVEEAPSEDVLMAQAEQMLAQGMAEDLIRRYDPERVRDTPVFAAIRGRAYLKMGMPNKAIENFRRAILLDPQYIVGYVQLAQAHEALGRYKDAVEQYKRAIRMASDLKLPDAPALHFRLGAVYARQDRVADAEAQFRKVLEVDRKHTAARLRLAALDLRKGDFQAALDQVNFVIDFCADTAEARFLAGLIHSAAARRPAEKIRAALGSRAGSDGPAAVTDRDIEAERHNLWNRAVRHYEKAIELDPHFRLSYEAAVVYAMQRRFDKMASVYLRAARVAPPGAKPQLLRRLAMAYLGAGDYSTAVQAAQEAVDLGLKLPRPDLDEDLRNRFTLVNCLLGAGEFQRARAELRRAPGMLPAFREGYLDMVDRLGKLAEARTEAGPDTPALHHIAGRELNLGLLFSRAGPAWLGEAERTYRDLLQQDAGNIVALRLLSDLYMATAKSSDGERLAKAEAVNRQILERSPRFALAFRNLAVIEELRTRSKAAAQTTPEKRVEAQSKAVELYERAVEADPDFWLARLELGALYHRAGMNARAKGLYEQVIALNPTQVQALNDYADLCAEERRDLEKAMEYARRAKKLSPFSGAVADTLGVLHILLGESEAAVRELEEARYLLPNHPTVLYHLAVAYAKTGKREEALALLDGLLDGDVAFPGREEAVRLREELRGR